AETRARADPPSVPALRSGARDPAGASGLLLPVARDRRRLADPSEEWDEPLFRKPNLIYWRFLETEDEYFDHAPAVVPPQGRWRIYGLGLPDAILKKVYRDNAARVLGLA